MTALVAINNYSTVNGEGDAGEEYCCNTSLVQVRATAPVPNRLTKTDLEYSKDPLFKTVGSVLVRHGQSIFEDVT